MVVAHSTVHDNSFLDVDQYVATLKASANNDPAKILAEVWGDWSATPASFFGHSLSEQRSKVPWIGHDITGLKDFTTKDLWLGLDFGVRAPSAVVLAYRTRNSIKLGDGRIIAPKSIILLDEFYSCLREKTKPAAGNLATPPHRSNPGAIHRPVAGAQRLQDQANPAGPQDCRCSDRAATGGMDGSIATSWDASAPSSQQAPKAAGPPAGH